MTICFPVELETVVKGHGDGLISISQKNKDGETVVIWLTVHQFSTIYNYEKHIVREAMGTE